MTAGAIETQPAPPLTRGGRALGLLTAEGASTALAIWFLIARGRLPMYVYTNTIPPAARMVVVAPMVAGAIAAVACGFGLWIARRGAGLDAIERIARRLAPLCLAAFAPLLLHWQLWTGPREITFAVLASAFGLALQALMRVALGAPPLLPAHLRARLDAARADVAASLARVPWLPAVIVALAVLRHAIFFSNITIRNHFVMQTAGYDLGIENNLVWNAAHWNGPLFKTSVQMGGPTGTHVGLHQTYISYLIGIPYRLLPRPETLLVLQSILIGGAAFPLFVYARRH